MSVLLVTQRDWQLAVHCLPKLCPRPIARPMFRGVRMMIRLYVYILGGRLWGGLYLCHAYIHTYDSYTDLAFFVNKMQ
jgi:hypothetical protein